MKADAHILVLGAYGLAGRAIVARLVERTAYSVVAAGRHAAKLEALRAETDTGRVQTLLLDATDSAALGNACASASLVINAVGPFARNGAAIARTIIENRRPCLDCANEQLHYRNLVELDSLARERGVPMVTAAGAIPGLSTLLTARLLESFPAADAVDCCWAQFRHAYAESGLASMMGGILEAAGEPVALCAGQLAPIRMGRSVRAFDLPAPFGRKPLMEVPTIEALTLPKRFPLREFHTWFYMGELPMWLLGLVRLFQPNRRPWAYRLIESVMRRINDSDTARAIAAGVGPECALQVTARGAGETRTATVMFRDGAAATACLPVFLADAYLKGGLSGTGLLTPLDLVEAKALDVVAEGAVLNDAPRDAGGPA